VEGSSGLKEDVADVGVDGLFGDQELLSDRLVGLAFGDQGEHVALACGDALARLFAARG